MEESKRSPMLKVLYPKKTDCVFEWIAGVLGESESSTYMQIKNYFDSQLAFDGSEFPYLESFYERSLARIVELKSKPEAIDLINQAFDEDMLQIANMTKTASRQEVKDRVDLFLQELGEISQVKSVS